MKQAYRGLVFSIGFIMIMFGLIFMVVFHHKAIELLLTSSLFPKNYEQYKNHIFYEILTIFIVMIGIVLILAPFYDMLEALEKKLAVAQLIIATPVTATAS